MAAAGDRVTFTRFLPPAEPTGAWVPYYEQWPFALDPATAPLYDLDDRLPHADRPTLDVSTFGKWTPALAERVGAGGHLVLTGVSTDCCVLSTATAAADAGVFVSVVSDACAGIDETTHQQALHALALYAPIIEIVSSQDLLNRWES